MGDEDDASIADLAAETDDTPAEAVESQPDTGTCPAQEDDGQEVTT